MHRLLRRQLREADGVDHMQTVWHRVRRTPQWIQLVPGVCSGHIRGSRGSDGMPCVPRGAIRQRQRNECVHSLQPRDVLGRDRLHRMHPLQPRDVRRPERVECVQGMSPRDLHRSDRGYRVQPLPSGNSGIGVPPMVLHPVQLWHPHIHHRHERVPFLPSRHIRRRGGALGVQRLYPGNAQAVRRWHGLPSLRLRICSPASPHSMV